MANQFKIENVRLAFANKQVFIRIKRICKKVKSNLFVHLENHLKCQVFFKSPIRDGSRTRTKSNVGVAYSPEITLSFGRNRIVRGLKV